MKKYTKAQKLKTKIDEIRRNYNEELTGKTIQERQRATAIYLIDKLALRVGYARSQSAICLCPTPCLLSLACWPLLCIDSSCLNVAPCSNEKDKSEVADTVGCCSLRVEHLKFKDDDVIEFDFLGKDSMRYFNAVKVGRLDWFLTLGSCS